MDLSKVSVQELFDEEPDNQAPEQDPADDQDTEGQGADDSGDNLPAEEGKDGDDSPKEEQEGGAQDEEKTMFQVLTEKLGYEIEGEFSEDYDGLVEFTKKAADKILEQEFQDLYEAMPDVFEYLQFRQNGGDPKTFFENSFKEVDYSTMKVTEDNERVQEALVAEWLKIQGSTPEEIKETLEDYKDTGILFKQASRIQPKLVKMQEDRKQQVIQQQQKQAEEARNAQIEQWKQIGTTINSGKLGNFAIPEADKKSFFDWLSQPIDKSGKSQMQLVREKMPLETALAIDYFLFKGLDLNKLVQNTKNTQQAVNLRNKLQTSKPGASSRMKTGAQTSARGVSLPGLSDLF